MRKIIPLLIGLMFLIPIAALTIPSAEAYIPGHTTNSIYDNWDSHTANLFDVPSHFISKTPTGSFNDTGTGSTGVTYYAPDIDVTTNEFWCSFWYYSVNSEHLLVNTLVIDSTLYLRLDNSEWYVYQLSGGTTIDTGLAQPLNTWTFIEIHYLNGQANITVGANSAYNLAAGATSNHIQYISMTASANGRAYIDEWWFNLIQYVEPTSKPVITSTPMLNIVQGSIYSYNMTANQLGGTWHITKPSWLASTAPLIGVDHTTIRGTAPLNTGNDTIRITYTTGFGVAYQNYTLTRFIVNPHFVVVDLFTLKPGSNNYSILVSWSQTDHGEMITPGGTFIDQLYAQFQPTYPYQVYMQLNMKVFDNLTQIYQFKFAQVVTDGNPNTVYTYYTGQPNAIGLTTQAGHFYYIQLNMKIVNQTGPIPSQDFSGSVTSSIPASIQQNWISGILWILILFTIPWVMNWFFPRYGFLLGMILMAVLLSISTPSFIYVGLIIVLVTAIEGYALSKLGV